MTIQILDSGRRIVPTQTTPNADRTILPVERIAATAPVMPGHADLRVYTDTSGEHHRAPLHDIMSEGLVALPPSARLVDALTLMHERQIHHLLVIEGDVLHGILSPESLMQWMMTHHGTAIATATLGEAPLSATLVMTADTPVGVAAHALLGHGVSAALVIGHHGAPHSIVTTTDFLKQLSRGHESGVTA